MTLEDQIAAGGLLTGAETIVHCKDCGEPSTASIQGTAGFRVIRGIFFCQPCADIREHGVDLRVFTLLREVRKKA